MQLADLEAVRLVLDGDSVIDWHRLNFVDRDQAMRFLRAQEVDPDDAVDQQRIAMVKRAAIDYLRRNFDFPVPKPVAEADLIDLFMLASTKGHRQLCACTILKVMHIIHHLEARGLLFMLPSSDQQVFHLVEQKVYRIVGEMLTNGFPIVEFIGGRKHKDSLYTKLLSKQETLAAQIYDKQRFRIVMRSMDDIVPMLSYLSMHLFPFNYVIPGESKNTLFSFHEYCERQPQLRRLWAELQPLGSGDNAVRIDNRFTSERYRVVHYVVDMPLRLPPELCAVAPPEARELGQVVFAQAEFQITDQQSEQYNELGDASHSAYKERQKQAVMRRLKLGSAR